MQTVQIPAVDIFSARRSSFLNRERSAPRTSSPFDGTFPDVYVGLARCTTPSGSSVASIMDDVLLPKCESVNVGTGRNIAVARFLSSPSASRINGMTSMAIEWLDGLPCEIRRKVDTVSLGSAIGPLAETILACQKSNPGPKDICKSFDLSSLCEIAKCLEKSVFPIYASSGCIAGIQALGALFDRIRLSKSRCGLALAVDYPLPDHFLRPYARMGMLRKFTSPYDRHSPWSQRHSGILLSEGISGMVLGSSSSVVQSGHRIIGWDSSTDGADLLHINNNPAVIAESMARSMDSVSCAGRTVLVMAHSNAIYAEDLIELQAIQLFAEQLSIDSVIVATVKDRIGHPFSAAALIQLQFALEAFAHYDILERISRFTIMHGKLALVEKGEQLPHPDIAIINARSFGSAYASVSVLRSR